jgi:hypothetical protein
MAFDWSDIVVYTETQARQFLLNKLDAVGFQATSWQEGSVPLALVDIGALVYSRVSEIAVALKNANFLQTATGDGLTAKAYSDYDTPRGQATTAVYNVTLSCLATEGPYTLSIDDVVITDGTNEFRNGVGGTLLAGGTLTLPFESQISGVEANSVASQIDRLVTTYAGVEITNVVQTQIAENAEDDTRLQERCRLRWPTLAPIERTRDALTGLVLNVDTSIASVAIDDENPRGGGTVDVYIAANAGAVTSGVKADVQSMLNDVFLGQPDRVQALDPTIATLDVTATVYYDPAFSAAEVGAVVEAQLQTWVNAIPLGGFDFVSGFSDTIPVEEIAYAIRSFQINGTSAIKMVRLSAPASDVAIPSFGKVVRGTWAFTYVAQTLAL